MKYGVSGSLVLLALWWLVTHRKHAEPDDQMSTAWRAQRLAEVERGTWQR